eukprot:COSAG06_NODE_17646_length_928_cov_1.638118_2_plen_111_part_00
MPRQARDKRFPESRRQNEEDLRFLLCAGASQCAWASLYVDKLGWVNATVSVGHDGQSLLLTAALPATTDADSGGAESAGSDQRGDMAAAPAVLGSAYGWVRGQLRFCAVL